MLRGRKSKPFPITCGIRQGCPLSPLLFAVVIDIFLRRLHRNFLTTTLRAFADDIGLIVKNVAHLMAIQAEFATFATISGLALNLPKTVLVPLWLSTIPAIAKLINDDYPCLAGMTISYSAKYLGIWMGPEGYTLAWTEALEKFKKAVPRWTTAGWGLQLATLIYNVYLSSILGFVAQFYPPTEEVIAAEQMALRRFLRGPGNWTNATELFHLDTWFGF